MKTANLQIGDTVYVDCGRFGRSHVYAGRVASKSPTGVIRVEAQGIMPRSFKPDGSERAKGIYEAAHIVDQETYDREFDKMESQNAVQAFHHERKRLDAITVNKENRHLLVERLNSLIKLANAL